MTDDGEKSVKYRLGPGHAPRSRDHLIVLGQTPLQRDAVSVLAVALVRVVFSAPVPMARADSGGGGQTVRQTVLTPTTAPRRVYLTKGGRAKR